MIRDELKEKEAWFTEKIDNIKTLIAGKLKQVTDAMEAGEATILKTVNDKTIELIKAACNKADAERGKLEDEYFVDEDGKAALDEVDAAVKAEIIAAQEQLAAELKEVMDAEVKALEEPIEQLNEDIEELENQMKEQMEQVNEKLKEQIDLFNEQVEEVN